MWFCNIQKDNYFRTSAHINDEEVVCRCAMYVDTITNTWVISSWYTEKDYQHHGYGKTTLLECLKQINKQYSKPNSVKYIWNGVNQYVFNWLKENFDAVCDCPLVIQKYASDDDWSSHIYTLNKDKFFEYFKI